MSEKPHEKKTGLHVKKGDTVYVLAGKNRGKSGKVLKAFPDQDRVVVQDVNIVSKHKKPQRTNPGGIVKQEGAIHVSNVMLVCGKCGAPTRVSRKVLENGEKVRICKRCNEVIDTIVHRKKDS